MNAPTDVIAKALVDHAVSEGLTVRREPLEPLHQGYLAWNELAIVVNTSLRGAAVVHALLHELGHYHDLKTRANIAAHYFDQEWLDDSEVVAEACALAGLTVLGVRTNPTLEANIYSHLYHHTKGDAARIDVLEERILKATETILAGLTEHLGLAA